MKTGNLEWWISLPLQAHLQKEIDEGVISINTLENYILSKRFIDRVEVVRHLNGAYVAFITQTKLVARLVSANKQMYLTEDAHLIKTIHHNFPLPIIFDATPNKELFNHTFWKSKRGESIIDLLQFLNLNKLRKHEITQIEIGENYEIRFFPQIGNFTFIFGKPEGFEDKLKKVDIFYEQILPQVGWDRYKHIDLRFEDQLVCK